MEDKPRNKYTELFKNTGLLAIGNFSSKILIFLLVPLYTNVLTTTEYGLYDIFITTVQLLIPVFTLNVTDGVLRFSLENGKNANQVFRVALKYSLLGIIPAIMIILINQLGGFSTDLHLYGIYVVGYYIAYMFNQLFIQFAKGIDKVSTMTISGVIGTITTIIACIICLLVLKIGLRGFFYANILGQLIPALYLIVSLKLWKYLKKPEEALFDDTLQKRLLLYSTPLIMTNIGWWLNNTFDRYLITVIKGVDVNGLLSIAYKIPSILTVLCGIFIQAWQISAMKEYGKKDSELFYNNIFVNLNLFVYIAASGLIIISRPLAHIAFAKDFYDAWIFVPYLVLSAVFTASSGYIAPILTSAYKTVAVAKSTIVGGLINIVLSLILLYVIGNIGVAVATMISSFVILYIRYKYSEGLITVQSFKKCCILWSALCIQASIEVTSQELFQIPLIIITIVLSRNEFIFLCRGILNVFRRKKR